MRRDLSPETTDFKEEQEALKKVKRPSEQALIVITKEEEKKVEKSPSSERVSEEPGNEFRSAGRVPVAIENQFAES